MTSNRKFKNEVTFFRKGSSTGASKRTKCFFSIRYTCNEHFNIETTNDVQLYSIKRISSEETLKTPDIIQNDTKYFDKLALKK